MALVPFSTAHLSGKKLVITINRGEVFRLEDNAPVIVLVTYTHVKDETGETDKIFVETIRQQTEPAETSVAPIWNATLILRELERIDGLQLVARTSDGRFIGRTQCMEFGSIASSVTTVGDFTDDGPAFIEDSAPNGKEMRRSLWPQSTPDGIIGHKCCLLVSLKLVPDN